MGTNDKIMHFWWMVGIITVNGEATSWVDTGQNVNTKQIIKGSWNFVAMAWWQITRHKLCPKMG